MIPFSHLAALVVAAVATTWDLRTRRIPNWLTFGAAAAAVLFHTFASGVHGLVDASAGLLVGLLIFLPFFVMRGIGAGDVKFLAALGAWIGPGDVVWTAAYGGIAGGVLALIVALSHRYLRQAFRNLWHLLVHWRVFGFKPMPTLTLADSHSPRLAYALPLSLGMMVTLWLR